ncbi:DUF5906 domain-containing protein [Alicyclobacillus fructus]|uniref:DUF5906 domain-containing protein n=1 Tax=Alicyclobacillus fructus TaxID=2816082 RepID=UPI001A8C6513|nr:DUF5906 domain-containing protein [Alicyclobacillus fructus]
MADCKLCNASIRQEIESRWLAGASYRELEQMCRERGVEVSHETVRRHIVEHALGGDARASWAFVKWWFEGVHGYVEIRPIPNQRDDREAAVEAARWRRSFPVSDLDPMHLFLSKGYRHPVMARCGWYFGVCPRNKAVKRAEDGRWVGGSADDVEVCPGAWVDVDDHGHEGDDERIAQAEQALTALADRGVVPSAVVKSGGGRGQHVYFKFTQPVDAQTGRRITWKLAMLLGSDPSVAEPARVMRLPGSLHTKSGQITVVKVIDQRDDVRYEHERFEAALEDVAKAMGVDLSPPAPSLGGEYEELMGDWAPVPLDFVKERLPMICARFEAYVQDPNIVSEPIWHKMSCTLRALNPDSSLFHEWSQAYDAGPGKRYNWAEAERKFRASRPLAVRCATFESLDPMEQCRQCPHFKHHSSPATFVRKAYATKLGLPGIYGMPGQGNQEQSDTNQLVCTSEEVRKLQEQFRDQDEKWYPEDPNPGVERAAPMAAGAEGDPVYEINYLIEASKTEAEAEDRYTALNERSIVQWARQKRKAFIDEVINAKGEVKEVLNLKKFADRLCEDFYFTELYNEIFYYDGIRYRTGAHDIEFLSSALSAALSAIGWHDTRRVENLRKEILWSLGARNFEESPSPADIYDKWDSYKAIPFKNGMLDISGYRLGDLLPHNPSFRCTWVARTYWNYAWAESKSKLTLREQHCMDAVNSFLEWVLPWDLDWKYDPSYRGPWTRDLFLAYLGYSLAKFDLVEDVFVVLKGPGGNGKSTFFKVLTRLFAGFISNLSPQAFSERFATAELVRSTINIDADIPNNEQQKTQGLKQVVSHDTIRVERKFRDSTPAQPKVKVWFAANELPPTNDTSYGYFRRFLIIPFESKMAKWFEQTKYKEEDLYCEEALSYWAYLGVKYYLYFRNQGIRIDDTPATTAAKDKYWASQDVVKDAVLSEVLQFDPGAEIPAMLGRMLINAFAESKGRSKLSGNKIFERLRNNCRDFEIREVHKKFEDGYREMYWRGVKLGPEAKTLATIERRIMPDGEWKIVYIPVIDEYQKIKQMQREAWNMKRNLQEKDL